MAVTWLVTEDLPGVLDPMLFQQMKEFKIPCSNMVRDYNVAEPRLTGLMLQKIENSTRMPS